MFTELPCAFHITQKPKEKISEEEKQRLHRLYIADRRKGGERRTIPHQPTRLFISFIPKGLTWAVFIRLRLREGKARPRLLTVFDVFCLFPHYSTESCNVDVGVFEPVVS